MSDQTTLERVNADNLRCLSQKAQEEQKVRDIERQKRQAEYITRTDIAINKLVERSIQSFYENSKKRAAKGHYSSNIIMWNRGDVVVLEQEGMATKEWPIIYLIKGTRNDTFDLREDKLTPFMQRLRDQLTGDNITVEDPKSLGANRFVIEGHW